MKRYCLFAFLPALLLCAVLFGGCGKKEPAGTTPRSVDEGESREDTLADGGRATFSGVLEPAGDGYRLQLERAETYYLSGSETAFDAAAQYEITAVSVEGDDENWGSYTGKLLTVTGAVRLGGSGSAPVVTLSAARINAVGDPSDTLPAADGSGASVTATVPASAPATQPAVSTTRAAKKSDEKESTTAAPKKAAAKSPMEAYRARLEDICANPGSYYDSFSDTRFNTAENKFAVADIDNDGQAELLVQIWDAPVAGWRMLTWKYNAKTGTADPYIENLGVATDFYKNSYAKGTPSHNHTYGSLYPYYVLRLRGSETEGVGSFYTMEKDIAGSNFVQEDDPDGDGVIYYFAPEGGDPQSVSKEEFDAMTAEYLPEDQKIAADYKDLTQANITAVCG